MYMAWLCYPHAYDPDEYAVEAKIVFEEPEDWKYAKIIPIQFSVLHQWKDKDRKLYE